MVEPIIQLASTQSEP